MTQPNLPVILSKTSQESVLQFHRSCYQMMNQQWNLRERMRQIDLAYIRENDLTNEQLKAKIANTLGDPTKFQNITIPVIMPKVEAAVTYQASVFLTGVPLFGVSASPSNMDAALQLESVIDDSATRGGWVRQFMMHFRDGFKYNFAPIEVIWDRKIVPSFDTDLAFAAGKQGKPKETIWEGNCINRLDPYNTFFDTRVPPAEVYKRGEFIGYTMLMSRIELKQFIAELPDKMIANIVPAFESGLGSSYAPGGIESYYIPEINPNALLQNVNRYASTNWLAWAGLEGNGNKIQYRDMYEVSIQYGRILPSDFSIKTPSSNTPQIWKFIIVNHTVVIYAERQTNAHNYLPILISQPLEDGLMYQTKPLAENIKPIQELSSALANSSIAARRRAISDRGLYDPSRVSAADINSANPSAKIPIRPSAYGKPLNEAYYPIPFRDDQSAIVMQQIQMLDKLADTITGQNPVKQGQFVKGNKTRSEFEDVMSHANGRDQLVAMLYEAQLFTPIKEILKSNILQYQSGTSVFNRQKGVDVNIDPVALRKAVLEFKVSDGLTPTDKLINEDVLMVALQQIGTSQQIGKDYNIGPLFSYLMKTQGADLKEFEKSPEQIAYETAMAQWQQLVMELFKQNPELKKEQLPPQPIPAQYNYQPQGVNPNAPTTTAAT